jgi:hypothetical protein
LIDKWGFRIEVLGAQVPDVIAERIFSIFSSVVSSQALRTGAANPKTDVLNVLEGGMNNEEQPDKMDFTDLCQCYFVFKYKKAYDVAQLCFEMLKITKEQDFVCRDDIEHWAVRIL